MKKFLQSFVDNTTLNWETFLPALAISYNTRYHSTIATMPFQLPFGQKAWLASFPNADIQQIHYGETAESSDRKISLFAGKGLESCHLPLKMKRNQKTILTKMLVHIILPSVTKCSFPMTFIQAKTLKEHNNSKDLEKLLTLMTLMLK
jgi:hypothetical protein